MADTENAGIATNAQAAKPISIERFMVSPFATAVAAPQDNASALQEFPKPAPRERPLAGLQIKLTEMREIARGVPRPR